MFRLQNLPVRKPVSLVNPIKEVVNSKVYLCSSCPHWQWICWQTHMIDCSIASSDFGAQDLLPKRFPELDHSGKFYRWSGETSKSNAMSITTAQKHLFGNSSWLRDINKPSPDSTKTPMFSSQGLAGPHCQDLETWRSADLLQTIQSWLSSVLLCSCGITA